MIVRFEEPIYKAENELVPGDVINTEYGDYGHYISVVFESLKVDDKNFVELTCHYESGSVMTMWTTPSDRSSKYKIVGKEVEDAVS